MQSHTEDDCIETYKDVKFNKKHRSVTYKVDKERVVAITLSRSSTLSVPESRSGVSS